MRNPASSARSSFVATVSNSLHGAGEDAPAGLEDPAQRGIAIQDGESAALEAVGAAHAEVRRQDVAQHHLRAQLDTGYREPDYLLEDWRRLL